MLTDRERRLARNGRHDPFEAEAEERELPLDDRLFLVRNGIEEGGDSPNKALRTFGGEPVREERLAISEAIPPDPAVRVDHDLDGLVVGKRLENDGPKLPVEFPLKPLLPNITRVIARAPISLISHRERTLRGGQGADN